MSPTTFGIKQSLSSDRPLLLFSYSRSSSVQDISKLPVGVPKAIIDVCVFPCPGRMIHCP